MKFAIDHATHSSVHERVEGPDDHAAQGLIFNQLETDQPSQQIMEAKKPTHLRDVSPLLEGVIFSKAQHVCRSFMGGDTKSALNSMQRLWTGETPGVAPQGPPQRQPHQS